MFITYINYQVRKEKNVIKKNKSRKFLVYYTTILKIKAYHKTDGSKVVC